MNSPVIEPVDVVKGLPLHALDVAPGTLAVNGLVFVEAVEGFDERGGVAVALRSNRGIAQMAVPAGPLWNQVEH